jgi:hypothetical protein
MLALIDIAAESLRTSFGFGVAGNFAGHLEQAGEARDFANIAAAAEMPKGIFPWYVPGNDNFLGTFPLSTSSLTLPPATGEPLRIQIEPEVGVFCSIERNDAGEITALVPQWIAAFDDCSWRKSDAAKISEKKNWGTGSKGVAPRAFSVSDIDPSGSLAELRLASFLRREGETHPYGVDSPAASYSLSGQPLLDWLVERLGSQRGAAGTPLEDVGALLHAATPAPHGALIGIGATRYEPFGESTFLEPGDDATVVLYDGSAHTPEEVGVSVANRRDDELHSASVLRRTAIA